MSGKTSIRPSARRRQGHRWGGPPGAPAALWVGAAVVAAAVLLLFVRGGGGESSGGAGSVKTPSGSGRIEAIPAAGAPKSAPDPAVSDRRWDEAKERAERAVSLLAEAESARSSGDSTTFQEKVRQAGEILDPACEAAARLQEELEAAGQGEGALAREIKRSLESWNRKRLVIHKTRATRR